MSEIVFLRSKAYSYKVLNDDKETKKLKGISKSTIDKYINFNQYKETLISYKKPNYNRMYQMNSEKHNMFVYEVNKKSLSPFDDKRYIFEDGITTLPHSDLETRNMILEKRLL
jgi:hypothetical protein